MKSAKSSANTPEYAKLLIDFDKAKSAYKHARVAEDIAKGLLKDASKSGERLLTLEYRHAKHHRKAQRALLKIAKLALKAWIKSNQKSGSDAVKTVKSKKSVAKKTSVEAAPTKKKRSNPVKTAVAIVEKPTIADLISPKPRVQRLKAKKEIAEMLKAVDSPTSKKRGRPSFFSVETEVEEGVAGASARLMAEMPLEKAPKAVKSIVAPTEKVAKIAKAPKAPKAEKAPKVEKVVAEKAPKVEKVVVEKAPRQKGENTAANKAEAAIKDALKGADFRIIEGIGPKVTMLLHENGITTFAELGVKSYDELKALMMQNKQYLANPTNWARQAKLAAAGKMAELETLKSELKRGL
jgi:predicted flap endonuclease-1-like 5' DNA nuclease